MKLVKFIPEIKINPNTNLNNIIGNYDLRKEMLFSLPLNDVVKNTVVNIKPKKIDNITYLFYIEEDVIEEDNAFALFISDKPHQIEDWGIVNNVVDDLKSNDRFVIKGMDQNANVDMDSSWIEFNYNNIKLYFVWI